DLAGRGAAGGYLPQLLDADRIALRVAVRIQLEALDELLGEAAARAFGQHGDLGLDVDAFGVTGLVRAVFGHAHVTDAHAGDRAILVVDVVGGGEAGEHVDAQRLGLRRQPGAQRAQRHDEVAVVVHARRQRQLARAGLA